MAGPYLNTDDQPIGSMLIMEFTDKDAVVAFSKKDPYALAGLFQSVSIKPWKKTLPA
jgi:uncharacterized protein YciI